jgi:voltage-gated sodium channel
MAAIIHAHHEAQERAHEEQLAREAAGIHQGPPNEDGATKAQLTREMTMSKLNALVPKPILPGQMKVLELYHGNVCQLGVAVLIFLNFIISAIEAQIMLTDEDVEKHGLAFKVFEWAFNLLFGIELIVNIYAHFLFPFWQSSWNVFDVVIVGISWVSMLGDVPGITVLRLFRAFRAFRLFKRIPSVRIIVSAVAASLPGVSNAFVLLIIIMGIWAIMGVSFFRHDFEDLFGNFGKAMLTLFQVMTFDSWVSGVTRPVCLYYNSWATPFYFISYMFTSGIIMTNVVVAILLDKFMQASEQLKEDQAAEKAKTAPKAEPEKAIDNDEAEPFDEAAAISKESNKMWHQLADHFCFSIGQMEKTCKKPLPETLQAEQDRLQLAMVAEEEARLERRRNDKVPFQSFTKECYESPVPQMIVALAICLNFLVSATKAELLPEKGSDEMIVFDVFEWFFNLLFGVELIVNMYANFFTPFWKDNWNIFDFFIVAISWLSMLGLLQGGISVLRLFRAFRVFRLFKRVKSLRQIIAGIIKSLPGVSNAFVILTLVMGIWSIMGKNFFGEAFPDMFGNFFKAMLSMFQVMSYDSWSSGITRPVVFHFSPSPIAPIFFITYVFISAIIMSNVVLAILLDQFLAAAAEFEQAERAESGQEECPTNFDDIIDKIDKGMFVETEHLKEFEKAMENKLNELHQLVQGPLRNFVVSQKNKAFESGAVPKKGRCCPMGSSKDRKGSRIVPA